MSAPWLQEEQAEKAAAKVGRLKVTYEREMEEVKIRRDTEIAQLNDMLLQKEEKSQEKQSRSKSEVEQLKAAMVKHSVRWVVAGGGEGRGGEGRGGEGRGGEGRGGEGRGGEGRGGGRQWWESLCVLKAKVSVGS